MNTIGKKIIVLFILIFTILLGSNYSFGKQASDNEKKVLGLYNHGNGRETGYYTVGKNNKQDSLPIIKIVEYQSNKTTQDNSKANQVIYCLKNGVGFGAGTGTAQTEDYTNYFDMRENIDTTFKSKLPSDSDYNSLMWLLDNICDPSNTESVNKLLDAAGLDKSDFGDLAVNNQAFKDVIEVIQQSAIWYITNKSDEAHRPSDNLVIYSSSSSSSVGQNIEDKYRFDPIESPVTTLYDYLIKNAERNTSYSYKHASTPISINSSSTKAFFEKNYFYVGPYSINGTTANITSATITVGDNSNSSAQLVGSNKTSTLSGSSIADQLKSNSNNQFYIKLPLSEKGKQVKLTVSSSISERKIEYWTTAQNTLDKTQPVVIIKEETTSKSVEDTKTLPELIEIQVQKVWSDASDQDRKRPQSITIQLTATNADTGFTTPQTLTLNSSNSWQSKFTNLPKTNANGQTITYNIDEVNIPDGYQKNVQKTSEQNNIVKYTITNTYTPEKVKIEVKKEWKVSQDDLADSSHPDNIEVVLYKNNQKTENTANLSESNNWQHTFENLPKKENGVDINYTVKEEIVEGFTPSIDKKVTQEENQTKISFTITNTKDEEAKTEINVVKKWDDGENRDGIRPNSVTVQLLQNGQSTDKEVTLSNENNWEHTFTELPVVDDAGNRISYSVVETNIPNGYQVSYQETDHSPVEFIVTNKHTPTSEFDLALRKFITTVNGNEVNPSREPDITQADLSNLANGNQETFDGTTSKKKHTKNPIPVKTGDRVIYTIRIYNEGDIDGYAEEITDYLPEGLELVPEEESEINKTYRWKQDISNPRIIKTDYLSKAQGDNLLKKFNKTPQNGKYTIDYADVKVECVVVQSESDKNINLKNVAEITDDDNEYNLKDRDSTPKDLTDEEKNNYNPGTSTQGKGYEDDDDYEDLVLQGKYFDLALRKFITAVNDNELKTGNKYDREPVVDVTPLLNGKTTASYKHTKKPVKVSIGDVVTYTIRVYNEGQVDGYVDEIVDHLPPELEFLPDDELNKKYLWTIDSTDETNRTIRTTYLSKERSVDNILKGFNGEELAYKDIQVRCKVVPTAPMGKIITNIADITERSNDENIPDRDNEKKVELPPDDKLPDYKGKETNKDDLSDSEYHYEGQEDDDDFEKLIIERFDLALRKFITGVNDEEITNRIPEVDTTKYGTIVDGKEVTTMEYKHTKEPVRVSHNDIVIYTIRVYNEGTKSGYAAEIKDDIPDGLEYVKDNEINNEYGWVLYDEEGNVTTDVKKAVTIRTDYLSKEKEQTEGENLLKGFDKETMDVPDYRDVKVAFKVTEPNTSDRIITNSAQISKDTDENGDEVDDDDSTPDEWKGEDDEDTEKVYVKYFDLSLRKWVSQVILIEDGVQKEMDTGHYAEQDPEPVVKVELNKKRIENTIIKFRYQIRIKNEGEIEGYATEISDYIPEGLKFNQADNPKWKEENGKIVTDQLKDTLLQPGETATIEVTLTWINDENNLSQKVNVAEISEDDNPSDTPDIDSTPNNKKDGEDDIDDAPVVLTVVTGKIKLYISLIAGTILIVGIGAFIIKKYII